MSRYSVVTQTEESTVVTEYKPQSERPKESQSEAQLENDFINLLQSQGYEYLHIRKEQDLILNLREKLEELNEIEFTKDEWDRFFNECIANKNDRIVEKTKKIQDDYIQVLKRDDGISKNIMLIDKNKIHRNKLQVINQYVAGEMNSNRYDVTILVNGLPLVHIELKRRGKQLKEAFNQIERYQKDSFWSSCGLYEFVQIFVISNGSTTKYYSNTTRDNHIRDFGKSRAKSRGKTSNSFEFTSYWADAKNKIIPDLVDFTKTFFSRHTILNILTRYCIFTSEKMLLVMRPYQIVATEKILNRISIAINNKSYGKIEAGGYIWHTTGSGKTLTSFKTAQLASNIPEINKVLFVVDRKDLDYQTMKEYDRFEKGAANSSISTAILAKQLDDNNVRIIVTTIQKLDAFIATYKGHSIFDKQVVLIFDECHRSQFGDMHRAIVESFKKYYLFGFTGTPIFPVNASLIDGIQQTTEQIFGDSLHKYTIVDAINDKNVLPFRVDYVKTMEEEPDIDDKKVPDIDREGAFIADERIQKVTKYILDSFDIKTYRAKSYLYNKVINIADIVATKRKDEEQKETIRLSGFNSIFCVSSIEAAIKYYNEFMHQIKERKTKLKIAMIYSFNVNEDDELGFLGEENSEETTKLDKTSRDFLADAINDYNIMFKTNYSISNNRFQNYYKDVSLRMKNRDIDLLIVVNMFLTGFDATTLNTLWVDKNLKQHGLIQAFSRTNRILNSIKTFGNIVCFRNLQKRTDAAISLFGDEQAGGIVLIKGFNDYYKGYTDKEGIFRPGYVSLIDELKNDYPLDEPRIEGEKNQKKFIALFGSILRMRNILTSFNDFIGNEILTEREMQDYLSRYNDLYFEWKKISDSKEKESIKDDIVFEVELVRQIEINIDYILMLVKKYHDQHCEDKEILIFINKAIDSSLELRSKKKLINNFLNGINEVYDVLSAWHEYVAVEKEKELASIIKGEKLNPKETKIFIDNSFRDGIMKTTGTEIDEILPSMSFFDDARQKTKKRVMDKLLEFFDRYFGIG